MWISAMNLNIGSYCFKTGKNPRGDLIDNLKSGIFEYHLWYLVLVSCSKTLSFCWDGVMKNAKALGMTEL